jgi:hypothetical protein
LARIYAGVPPLKRYETDDIDGDRAMMHRHFPELTGDTVPYRPNTDLPNATLKVECIAYITSAPSANVYAAAIIDTIASTTEYIYYGFDAEWKRASPVVCTAVFTFSFPQVSDVAIVHLPDSLSFPKQFKKLLELPNMVACDRQVSGDVSYVLKECIDHTSCD